MSKVKIDRVGKRIYLRTSRPVTALAKKIPGSAFSKAGGPHWSIPLSLDSCTLLREIYGDDLVIGDALWDWAEEQVAEERLMKSLTGPSLGLHHLPQLFPRLARAITEDRPYQEVGANWIANGRNVLIGDTVGLGKTVQTLAGVIESGVPGPYLVICPKTAVDLVWAPEIRSWLPGHQPITLPEGRGNRDAVLDMVALKPYDTKWVIVHPEIVRVRSWWVCGLCGAETPITNKKSLSCKHDPKGTRTRYEYEYPQLFKIKWGAIIADESDRSVIKASGTPTLTRRGMELLRDNCTREDGLRIAQSGTPFRSRPQLLWSTLNWLRPKEFGAYWRWAETFFEIGDGYGGAKLVGALRPDREAMLYRSLDRVMLRRTMAEVAPHLPPKLYVGTHAKAEDPTSPVAVWMPMEPAQARAYRQMLETSMAEIEGGELSAIGVLAELTRLKQFATSAGRMDLARKSVKVRDEYGQVVLDGKGRPVTESALVPTFFPALPSNKLNYLIQMLEELGYPDDPQSKIVVVSQFTLTLELFGALLDKKFGAGTAAYITGAVTGADRRETVDAFNRPIGRGGPNVLMLNIKAGGAAITLDAADEMVFLDRTWNPDDHEQAEGRINNRRPEEKILQRRYRYLMSRDTVELGIAMVNMERSFQSHRILDGRRGIQYAKSVLEASR